MPMDKQLELKLMSMRDHEEVEVIVCGEEPPGGKYIGFNCWLAKLSKCTVMALSAKPHVTIFENKTIRTLDLEVLGKQFVPLPSYDANAYYLGALDLWEIGLSGRGIRVGIIDSGVDPNHPALQGKIDKLISVIGGDGVDRLGHGTAVAGMIAGSYVEGSLGATQGVAPNSSIVSVQVTKDGRGKISDAMMALDILRKEKVDIINISMGAAPPDSGGTDPLSMAIDQLSQEGIHVVVAAGNSGPSPRSLGDPAAAKTAITVGSAQVVLDPKEVVAPFSSRGPTSDGRIKPDYLGTGGSLSGNIMEAIYLPSAGVLDKKVDGVEDGFAPLMGTSFSAPQIAGVLALLKEGGLLTPDANVLQNYAIDYPPQGKDTDSGWGRVVLGVRERPKPKKRRSSNSMAILLLLLVLAISVILYVIFRKRR
ncbi:hypothetical protein DRN93_02350 [archaeon]|nr:MAG: hypothetical protein DRN93_02350 [archaeon]